MLDRSSGAGTGEAAPLLTTGWTRFLYCDALEPARLRQDASGGRGGGALAVLRAWAGSIRRRRARAREARETRAALHGLDDRSLQDLGLTRDEIGSVAAEATGQASCTRMRVLHDLRACDAAAAHALLASWVR